MIDFAPPKAPLETDLETRLDVKGGFLCDHQDCKNTCLWNIILLKARAVGRGE